MESIFPMSGLVYIQVASGGDKDLTKPDFVIILNCKSFINGLEFIIIIAFKIRSFNNKLTQVCIQRMAIWTQGVAARGLSEPFIENNPLLSYSRIENL